MEYYLKIKELNDKELKSLREYVSPQVIRTCYMLLILVTGNKVSYEIIYEAFGISIAQYNRDIKAIKLCTELLFGDEAYIIITKEKMTYELVLPLPYIRLNLGI